MDDDARSSTASERHVRDLARANPYGVPITPADHASGDLSTAQWAPLTSPHELLESELSDEDKEAMRRAKRPTDTPANLGQVLKVVRHGNKHFAENKAAIQLLGDALLRIEQSTAPVKINAIDDRLDALEVVAAESSRALRIVKWMLGLLSAGGIGSVIAFGDRMWDRAEREGEATIRLKHAEEQLDQLRQDLRDERSSSRRYVSPAPDHPSWLQPPTKDVKP